MLLLHRTKITDDGLRHLGSLSSLELLGLDDTRIAGQGLRHLATLPNLRELGLSGTKLTDNALQYLQRFHQLKRLEIGYAGISGPGAAALRKALPQCSVETESRRAICLPW
jgi:hypothetical protein